MTLLVKECIRSGCNKLFMPKRDGHLYCSTTCSSRVRNDRRYIKPELALGEETSIEVDVDHVDDLATLLQERGLILEEWEVVRVTVNKWEGFVKDAAGKPLTVPLRQLKVFLKRKVSLDSLIQPVKGDMSLRFTNLAAPRVKRACKLIFLYGDDQRPNVERNFERLKLKWLQDNQPDEVVDIGDGMDFPTLSKYKINPAANWSVQACVDTYGQWLWELRNSVPDAKIRILADNHVSARIRDYQLSRAEALYGVTPADIDGMEPDYEPLWSVRRLLRLGEMGIEYNDPPSHYADSQYEIIPGALVAIHGYRTGQNLGKKFVDDYGCSVIYGHEHKQNVYVTDHKRRGVGDRTRLYALGVGCGAEVHGGGGFAPGADWQNGALTVSVFDDGHWSFDFMNYHNGVLTWRDQRYVG